MGSRPVPDPRSVHPVGLDKTNSQRVPTGLAKAGGQRALWRQQKCAHIYMLKHRETDPGVDRMRDAQGSWIYAKRGLAFSSHPFKVGNSSLFLINGGEQIAG